MPGKGKYTTYVPKKNPKTAWRLKLYKDSPFNGVEDELAPAYFSAMGNMYLSPTATTKENPLFPEGVNLRFNHPNAPNLPDVHWTKAGDPAGPYYPDIMPPGAGPEGHINVAPNETNPDIKIEDLKQNYVPGVLGTYPENGTGTVNPAETTPKVAQNATLGKDFILGYSFDRKKTL